MAKIVKTRYRLIEPLPDGATRVSVRELTLQEVRRYAARGWDVEAVPNGVGTHGPIIMGRSTMPLEAWVLQPDRALMRPTRPAPNWKMRGQRVPAFRRRTIF